MSKKLFILFSLFILFFIEAKLTPQQVISAFQKLPKQPRGGYFGTCIACTIGMKMLSSLAEQHGGYEKAFTVMCNILPADAYLACKTFEFVYGKTVTEHFNSGKTIDEVCWELSFCEDRRCVLYPRNSTVPQTNFSQTFLPRSVNDHEQLSTWWEYVLKLLGLHSLVEVFKHHLPIHDDDKDLFSIYPDLRGYSFRGRDCNPDNAEIYPGRKSGNNAIDHNCNGIYGVNPKTNKSYEEELCGNSEQRGLIIVGDSACAHFHVPSTYVNLTGANQRTFRHLMSILKHEFDWPHLSWATGFMNDTTGDNRGNVDSIYFRLRERNRCNHRDYQNICINGGESGKFASYMIKHVKRNRTTDHPAIVFLATIGNDVCDRIREMVEPHVFHANMVKTLDYLETILPKNSYVIFIGHVDGRILWNELHNEMHPSGTKYSQFYAWLSCLKTNPCPQWMTADEAMRNRATARAKELNAQYHKIIQERSNLYKQFKMIYMEFPLEEAIRRHVAKGGKVKDLIEPFDGFHPSQEAQNLMAKLVWEFLSKNHPEVLGPVNPKNGEIERLFNNQGGH